MSKKTVTFPSGTVTSDINHSLTNDTLVFNGGATLDLFNPETVKSINVSGPTSSDFDTINLSSNLTVKQGMQFINGEMLIHDTGASANLTLDGDTHLVNGTDLNIDKVTLNGNLFMTGQAYLSANSPGGGVDVTGHGTVHIGGGSDAILGHVDPKIGITFDGNNGGFVSMLGANGNRISGFAGSEENQGAIDHRHSGTVRQALWQIRTYRRQRQRGRIAGLQRPRRCYTDCPRVHWRR